MSCISIVRGPGKPERYVPEKILRQRIRNGKLQYLVKWERYPESEATWEPVNFKRMFQILLLNF